MTFAIKTEIREPRAETFAFEAQKTMYGGKHIAQATRSSSSRARMKAGPVSSPVALSGLPQASHGRRELFVKHRA